MNPESLDIIFDTIEEVFAIVGDCDDWVTVKKQLLLTLPPELRKAFSTRDPKTKEQSLNDFEKDLIVYYSQTFGIELVLRTLAERREMFDVL